MGWRELFSMQKHPDFESTSAIGTLVRGALGWLPLKFPLCNPNKPLALVQQYRSWVFACAKRNAEALASTPLRLYVTKEKGQNIPFNNQAVPGYRRQYLANSKDPFVKMAVTSTAEVAEVTSHPFLNLMRTANPLMDGFEVLQLLQTYMELVGDSYLYMVKDRFGTPKEIWPLMAQYVTIVPSETKVVDHYEYRTDAQHDNTQKLWPGEISHCRMPNPNDFYYGASPVAAASAFVDSQNYIESYEENLFKNRGAPDQLLIPNGPIPPKRRKKMEKDFRRRFGGTHNAGKTMVMPFDLKLEQLSNPRDIAFLVGKKATRDDICAMFDIPPASFDTSGLREASEGAEYVHAKYGVLPRTTRMQQKLNQDVVSCWGPRFFCAFDNPVPEDRDRRLKEVTANLRSGYSSINEARTRDHLGPVPWGNEPILPANLVPLSLTVERAQQEIAKGNTEDLENLEDIDPKEVQPEDKGEEDDKGKQPLGDTDPGKNKVED
jgi:HK97 family phage portal protein